MAKPVSTPAAGAKVLNALFGSGPSPRGLMVAESGAIYRIVTAKDREKVAARGEKVSAERQATKGAK